MLPPGRHPVRIIATLTTVLLITASASWLVPGPLSAQEMSQDVIMLAMVHNTVGHRFGSDLEVGDWVEYQLDEGVHIKLEVIEQEQRGVWISEDFSGMKLHLLVDLENMTLLEAARADAAGNRSPAPAVSEEQIARAWTMVQQMQGQSRAGSQITSWVQGEGSEDIEVAGTPLACSFLDPGFSEQHRQTLVSTGLDVEQLQRESRICFCEDVPRLIPLQFIMGWIAYVDAIRDIPGGMVECRPMHLKLVDFGRG